jgi:predicted nuclease of predicted toxin-antitoxin system
MRILADENVKPAYMSALDSAGHDVMRVGNVLEKGASDSARVAAGREADRIVVTYDRKDFANVTNHIGVFIAGETCAAPSSESTCVSIPR